MNGFYAGSPPQTGFYPMPAYAPGPQTRQLTSNDVGLTIRQQPKEALVTQDGKEKSRKPVDPPPILQLHVNQAADPHQHWLQSPYLFVTCALIKADSMEAVKNGQEGKQALTGSLVSSLHRLKDTNNQDGGFFVFGDVSVRVVGTHRLHFSLFDFHKDTREVSFLTSATTEPFKVVPAKDFRGLDESTYLSRAFSDQGVRLRLRKEPRAFTGNKRSFSYTQRHSDERENSQSGDGIPYDPHYHHQDSQGSPKRQNMKDDYGGYDQSQSPHAVRPPSANGNPYSMSSSSYAPEMQTTSQHPDFQRQYVFAGLSSTGQNQYMPTTTATHQGNLYGHSMSTNGYMTSHNNMSNYRLSNAGALSGHFAGGPVVPSTEADYSAINPELPSFPFLPHRADEMLARPMSRYQEAVEAETHHISQEHSSARELKLRHSRMQEPTWRYMQQRPELCSEQRTQERTL